MRFFAVGPPVSQIGGTFTVTGIPIVSGNTVNVTWNNLGGLVLPDNVIFTVSIAILTGGVDVGLDLFEPPTPPGSSSNQFYITYDGSTYSQTSQGNSQDNIYFSLDASTVAVPEPATMLLTLLGIPALALLRRRR